MKMIYIGVPSYGLSNKAYDILHESRYLSKKYVGLSPPKVLIVCDDGHRRWLEKEYFITMSDSRDSIIDSIIV